MYQGNTQFPLLTCIHNMISTYDLHNTYYLIAAVCKQHIHSSPPSSSCIWQLGSRVAIILLGRDYAADAMPLYQYTGTHFVNLGRITG